MSKTALLAGATGLVGQELLGLLLASDRYNKVVAITRKPLSVQHPKLRNVVADFSSVTAQDPQWKADDVFCCLGTTIRKVKTKEAFRQVDFEYPLQLARVSHELGASQFLLISALGANAQSSIFYNRVKGEVENAISYVGFASTHFFRPSLLLGNRSEARSGEDAAKVFYKLFGFLIPKKYKGIEAIKVARGMLANAEREDKGIFFHESIELQNY